MAAVRRSILEHNGLWKIVKYIIWFTVNKDTVDLLSQIQEKNPLCESFKETPGIWGRFWKRGGFSVGAKVT